MKTINNLELNSNTNIIDLVPVVNNIITNYCIDNDVNESDIFPTVWNDILTEIYYTLFYKTTVLQDTPNINNAWNQQKVMDVYDLIYKRICDKHCQEISIKGFSNMIGIQKETFYDWSQKPSCIGSTFNKRVMDDNEQSLEELMHDRRNNPMKYLPSLNRKHGWNMPGTKTESGGSIRLSLADLKKLPEITQNE